ncbi:MAG: MerC domain-containing protein [Planctomycetota bacterium]
MTQFGLSIFQRTSWTDLLGAGASMLCAAHCLATPFVLLALPTWGATYTHPAMHWLLTGIAVPLGLWAMFRGYLRHRRFFVPPLMLAGLVLVVVATAQPALASPAEEPVISEATPTTQPAVTSSCAACCPAPVVVVDENDEVTIEEPAGRPWPFYAMVGGGLLLVFGHGFNLVPCRAPCCAHRRAGGDV